MRQSRWHHSLLSNPESIMIKLLSVISSVLFFFLPLFFSFASTEPVWTPWICGSSPLYMKRRLKTEWRCALCCWATGLTRPCSTATAKAPWTWHPLPSWRRDLHVSVALNLHKVQLQSTARLNESSCWFNERFVLERAYLHGLCLEQLIWNYFEHGSLNLFFLFFLTGDWLPWKQITKALLVQQRDWYDYFDRPAVWCRIISWKSLIFTCFFMWTWLVEKPQIKKNMKVS